MSTSDNFRSAMRAAGLDYGGPILADGELHRFMAEGDKARNSWYVLHAGPPAAGAFGCWKHGVKETWCDRNGHLSQDEWNRVRERFNEAERARELAEMERHASARKAAARIVRQAKPTTTHTYLDTKGVQPHGDIRTYRGALVAPLRNSSGELHSLQFIGADGSKKFLTGGRIAGCYFIIADNPDGPLVLCEGFATGASIHEATGFAVICAMHAGNLEAVAVGLREKSPKREIIVAADNDQFTEGNPGLTKATAAAKRICAKLAVPEFQDVTAEPTDFNDLHQLASFAEVARQIEAALAAAQS
jgi:putative DNA primase/helicase